MKRDYSNWDEDKEIQSCLDKEIKDEHQSICIGCDNKITEQNYGNELVPQCNTCWQQTQRPPTSDGYEEDIALG